MLRRTAFATLATTVALVAIGGFTRASGSGFGCGDRWPLCEGGVLGGLLPRWEFHMVVEWSHRWLAAVVGVLVVALAVLAWRARREDRRVLAAAIAALLLVGWQGNLGRMVVQSYPDRDLVALHLTTSMLVVGVLAYLASHASAAQRAAVRAPDRAWLTRLTVGAAVVLAVIVLGATVHDRYVGGWPLVGGELVPAFTGPVVTLHFAHRVASLVGLIWLAALAVGAVRRARPRTETSLVHAAAALFALNVGLGAVHVFTRVGSVWLVVAHLTVATLTWAALVAAATLGART